MLENPDQELMMKELQEHINSILAKLPERSREVFLLSRHDGLKNREIAEKLNISIKVVERHISKALNLFRSSLSAEMALYADLILFITLAE
jgi:RNA polymerase sigma-70 factor (ECF subfamily)